MDALKKVEKIIWENTFEQKKKKPGLKLNPGRASANRPSNNWAQGLKNLTSPVCKTPKKKSPAFLKYWQKIYSSLLNKLCFFLLLPNSVTDFISENASSK